MPAIDPQAATIDQLQLAIGEALKARIEADGTVTRFSSQYGIGKTSLYRLFGGEGISLANLLRLLRGLGMFDVIDTLLTPPAPASESPLEIWRTQGAHSTARVEEASAAVYATSHASARAEVKSMLAKPKGPSRS